MEAWEFILAGGALFSHLDYSFTVGHEDGSYEYPPTQPGGGNRGFRKQMRILREFIGRFDFVRMRPAQDVARVVPAGARARVLADDGRQVAVYVFGKASGKLGLALPKGRYEARWTDTITGAQSPAQAIAHGGGDLEIALPDYAEDAALAIRRK
jgi:hypothetical protein